MVLALAVVLTTSCCVGPGDRWAWALTLLCFSSTSSVPSGPLGFGVSGGASEAPLVLRGRAGAQKSGLKRVWEVCQDPISHHFSSEAQSSLFTFCLAQTQTGLPGLCLHLPLSPVS